MAALFLLLGAATCQAADPPLARLSFWVAPEQKDAFHTAYKKTLAPLMKTYGIQPISAGESAVSDSIYSLRFELKSLPEFVRTKKALDEDATLQKALQNLTQTFGINGTLRTKLNIHTAPAGPGKVTPARLGKQTSAGPGTDHWRTYDVTHGLSGPMVNTILQDREGHFWFGTGAVP